MNGKNLGVRIIVIAFATTLLSIGGYVLLLKKISTSQRESIAILALAQNELKLKGQMTSLPENPSWQDLNMAQRDALSPLNGEWNALNTARKQKWLYVAHNYFMMKPEQQQRAQKRMRVWVSMTVDQREIARENYVHTLQIDSHRKARQWERYQQLPDDQKKKLANISKTKRRLTNLTSNDMLGAQGIPPFESRIKNVHPMTAQALASEK